MTAGIYQRRFTFKVPWQARIWQHVAIKSNQECWNWNGGLMSGRYGVLVIENRSMAAHRAMWTLFHGEPPKDKLVCHKCDNGLCCNPEHLFLGSHVENMRDMTCKDRQSKGEGRPSAKLKVRDIYAIRKMLKDGFSQTAIALKYGVRQSQISSIKLKKTWKHVKEGK